MNKQNALLVTVAIISLLLGGWVYRSQLPDFSSVQGEAFSWSQLNQKTVVVNYFAEWCAPCLKEIPELNEFAEWSHSHDDIEFMAISYDPLNDTQLLTIIEKYDMRFAVIGQTGEDFPIQLPQYLPATFIIKQGKVSTPLLGEQTLDSLINAVTR